MGCDLSKGVANCGDKFIRSSRFGAAQQRFDLAPHLFNRIEVRRVGGQEECFGTCGFDEFESRIAFVGSQIVHDDQIAGQQRKQEVYPAENHEPMTMDGRTMAVQLHHGKVL